MSGEPCDLYRSKLRKVAILVISKLAAYFLMPWSMESEGEEYTFHAHDLIQAVLLPVIQELQFKDIMIIGDAPCAIKGCDYLRHSTNAPSHPATGSSRSCSQAGFEDDPDSPTKKRKGDKSSRSNHDSLGSPVLDMAALKKRPRGEQVFSDSLKDNYPVSELGFPCGCIVDASLTQLARNNFINMRYCYGSS